MDFQGAKRAVDKALELDKKYVKAWARKGDIEFLQKEYHKAMDSYQTVIFKPTIITNSGQIVVVRRFLRFLFTASSYSPRALPHSCARKASLPLSLAVLPHSTT
jgi:hypothetical protein